MPLAIRWTARWCLAVAFVGGLGLPAGLLESPTAFGQCYERQKLRAVDSSARDLGSLIGIIAGLFGGVMGDVRFL